MQKHPHITRQRLKSFMGEWGLRGRLYPRKAPVTLAVYRAPGRISYDEALRGEYRPARVGEQFGPLWSTHWFRVGITIPPEWAGEEVYLLWHSTSEACVWQDGQPMQGLSGTGDWSDRPTHHAYRLAHPARGGETVELHVEMAVQGLFGQGGIVPDPQMGLLQQAEIAVLDRAAWDLLWDFVTVAEMAEHLPPDSPRAGQALYAANAMINAVNLDDRSTWRAARAIAAEFLAVPNGGGQHNVSAIGHAHIDTGWLWPIAETRRKCARTFSSVLRYMEDYPDYLFACSQAQQYAWIKESYPGLYERIRARVAEGRFIPVGGTWVEPDTNIPSGESLVRQFLYGQRFFRREFGITCREFWLPDTFGYSAALPQIMRGAGIRFFLTQKLSWNQFNKPANSTFIWEGLDGSQVLVHFPPVDTYNALCTPEELLFSVRNFKDHERARESLYPFGYGDGGGGPNPEMLERLSRVKDVDGLPRVEMRPPIVFFERAEADIKDPVKWVGELYFEYHRGTYTTHADVKRNNRRAEFLLHDVELLAALAHAGAGAGRAAYPHDEIDRLWRLVLLNQFHDILPGTSIQEVYVDTTRQYKDVLASGAALREAALDALFPPGGHNLLVVNTLGVPRVEVIELPGEPGRLGVVSVPALGCAVYEPGEVEHLAAGFAPVSVEEAGETITLENEFIRAVLRRDGHLISLIDRGAGREAIQPGALANHFVIYEDDPVNWDAWDVDVFHLEKREEIAGAHTARVIESGPLRAAAEFEYRLNEYSTLRQVVSLDCSAPRLDFACDALWYADHRFLKVEFPLNVRADHATYEVQFGYVQRPTHFNTTWDLARFEVPAHRWADLSEAGFGVALLNDCKYGHAAHGNVLRLSLLRASRVPDPAADKGKHAFRYALLPHPGTFYEAGVIAEALRFNHPPILRRTTQAPGDEPQTAFLSVDSPAVIVDTVKKAEDSDALIVRLYESHGGRGPVRLTSTLPVAGAARCDLLEENDVPLPWDANEGLLLEVGPFEIVTLKLALR